MSSEKCIRVRFIIYNEEVENTVNDRLKKKLLCFERALSTLEGYEGWMIGTTTLHLDWQPKQGENEFCHTKLTPEIIKKGRSAIRVRIAAAEEEKERENEEMEVLLVKPRQSVLVPEKEKMPIMKAITELGSEDEAYEKPDFIGREVTGDKRFYNSHLLVNPFCKWRDSLPEE